MARPDFRPDDRRPGPPRPPREGGNRFGPGGPRGPGGPPPRGGSRGGPGGPRGGPRDGFGPPRFDDRRPPRKPEGKAPEIIHRDRDLLVVVKSPGQPTRKAKVLSLVSIVNEQLASRRERYRPVHDLDEVASGVVALVPITDDDDIKDEIRSSVTYLALVEGDLQTGDMAERSITGAVPGLSGRASAPVTSVRVVGRANGLTLVRVRARPDATGQVRAHLALIGHRVVGDAEHGSSRDDVKRVALHAEEIRLRHPTNATTERYRCPAPASFYRAVNESPAAGSKDDEAPQPKDRGWEQVAGWYDDLITSGGSDHHERTVLPGVERLLALQAGERVVDIACGQGVLCARLAARGDLGGVVGVDASPSLIAVAQQRLGDRVTLMEGDARRLDTLGLSGFDAATCVLALMNIDDLEAACRGAASVLRPGGRFVGVILHPAFRSPQTTAWGWTNDGRTGVPIQFRRVDRYMSERHTDIVMNPGEAAAGKPAVVTVTHHRPVSVYVNALAAAGMCIDALEEWVSDRRSQAGPRADAENMARTEIPMFLAIRARRM